MLFIGHTRFSLFDPTSGAWLASNGSRFDSADSYKSYLFDEERLSVRANLFINYSLPQLEESAKDFDYVHVVSYSDSLPSKYQVLLQDAAEHYEFLLLDRHIDGKGQVNLEMLARKLLGSDGANGDGVFGMFRLDDDDLLSSDYFRQASEYLSDDFVGCVISFGSGLTAIFNNGEFYFVREAYSPLNSMGQMKICRLDDGKILKPIDASHNRIDRYNPVILDSRKTSYLWVRHEGQDTALNSISESSFNELATLAREMQRFPAPTNLDSIVSKFGSINGKFDLGLPGTNQLMANEFDLSTGELRVPFSGLNSNSVYISGSLVNEVEANSRAALIRFVIQNKDDPELRSGELSRSCRTQGVFSSSNPEIGYFRYLGSNKDSKRFDYYLTLPEGYVISELVFRNWIDTESQNMLRNIVVRTL